MIALRYSDMLSETTRLELESLVAQLRGFLSVAHDETGELITPSPIGLLQVGMVVEWAGVTSPDRWLRCDGSQVSRVTYKALFEVIGTAYGAGDGSTTFHLPDASPFVTFYTIIYTGVL